MNNFYYKQSSKSIAVSLLKFKKLIFPVEYFLSCPLLFPFTFQIWLSSTITISFNKKNTIRYRYTNAPLCTYLRCMRSFWILEGRLGIRISGIPWHGMLCKGNTCITCLSFKWRSQSKHVSDKLELTQLTATASFFNLSRLDAL